MNAVESLVSVVESVRENASTRVVYGEPIVTEGRTTVPVARVAYGFGGGFGRGSGATPDGASDDSAYGEPVDSGYGEPVDSAYGEPVDSAYRAPDRDADAGEPGGGSGGGMGGGAAVQPLGVVEITESGVRFVRFGGTRRLVAAAGVGGLAGLLVGRYLRRAREE
jgi:uncharacterized spore protein YtfJ